MIGLLQRVSEAAVTVGGEEVGRIGQGLLVLVGVERDDTAERGCRLLERLLGYRVFADSEGRMNLNLQQVEGGLLLVPQFTLVADTRKGTRPGFSRGAIPERGQELFLGLCREAEQQHPKAAFGRFGADMQVSLVNDGPVTFWLQT